MNELRLFCKLRMNEGTETCRKRPGVSANSHDQAEAEPPDFTKLKSILSVRGDKNNQAAFLHWLHFSGHEEAKLY